MARFCFQLAVLAAISSFDQPLAHGIKINGMDVALKSYSDCDEYPSLKLAFKNLVISQAAKKKYVVDGEVDLDVDITNDVKAQVEVSRCEDSTGEDSCEFMGMATGEKFCDKIKEEGTPWNNFMKQTDFGTSCPLKPGKYSVHNASLEVEDADGISLTPGYWKLRMEVFDAADASNPIGCSIAEVSVDVAREGY
ncbi:hypothetical protein J437_LFUL002276 [Ladona fulva]|uniref:Uncharacterized protein n=1 Tax=Ladona fulva TaxID=123851 RepID=A0A8K0JYI5_LADFU|nr:hypothetical protein J437_LFUL002276 [Ladona fulva]